MTQTQTTLDYDVVKDRKGRFYAEIFDPVSGFDYAWTDTYDSAKEAALAAERTIRNNGFLCAPAE